MGNGDLTEKNITENADIVDWDVVITEMDHKQFSIEFFRTFKSEINWTILETIYMTTELSHEFHEEIGCKGWYKDGVPHREDGPAILSSDGSVLWYKDGELHREDGPAEITESGDQFWFKNGQQHREGGPAYIGAYGGESWIVDGTIHREDGPAYTDINGTKIWIRKGMTHNEHGPSVIYPDGICEWHLNGKVLTESEWKKSIQKKQEQKEIFIFDV